MNSSTILLTGGSGMVGRNILEHPKVKKWHVIAPTSKELDLTDFLAVDSFVRKVQPKMIVHAAGHVGGIQANIENPIMFMDRNLTIGRNIIMASHQAGVRQFLNIGSTCMYPRFSLNPLHEEMILTGPLEPTNEGYALAKIIATRLCQYIQLEDANAQFKTIIPCNLFGRYDNFDPKSSHLLPAIIHKVHSAKIAGDTTVEIWGDGTARREFMYAGDLADAILRAVENFDSFPEIMNCGIGLDYSINEYYQAVAEVIGWKGIFRHDLSRPVGMKQKLASVERQSAWDWSAPTTLRDAIAKTYDYYINEAKK